MRRRGARRAPAGRGRRGRRRGGGARRRAIRVAEDGGGRPRAGGRARGGRGAAAGRLPAARRARGSRTRSARAGGATPAGRPRRAQPRRQARGRPPGPGARARAAPARPARRPRARRRRRPRASRSTSTPRRSSSSTTLDGVGPATAQKILDYREEHGGFGSVDELGEIPGIGEKRLATLREQVTRRDRRPPGACADAVRRHRGARLVGFVAACCSAASVGGAAAAVSPPRRSPALLGRRPLGAALAAAAVLRAPASAGCSSRPLAALAVPAGAAVADARLAALDAGRARRGCTGRALEARAVLLEPRPPRATAARSPACASRRVRLGGARPRGAGRPAARRSRAVARRRGRGRARGGRAPAVRRARRRRAALRGRVAPLGDVDAYQRRRGAHAALDVASWCGDRRARAAGSPGGSTRVRERRGRRRSARGLPRAGGGAAARHGARAGRGARRGRRATTSSASGLAHLLAVSGQNVLLLALLVLAACAVARRRRCGRGCSPRRSLVALYVPLAGGGPSIQRAGVMGVAGLVAALAGRPASRWYALGLAAAVTLALNPRAAGEPGLAALLRRRRRRCSRSAPPLRDAARAPRLPGAGRRGGGDHGRGDARRPRR